MKSVKDTSLGRKAVTMTGLILSCNADSSSERKERIRSPRSENESQFRRNVVHTALLYFQIGLKRNISTSPDVRDNLSSDVS